ncbi:MAG: hypothetical protein JW920_02490 [Deltaproteobacteria bacterium]|nr:hypothetical protein [Deltaproteobacteria bacterium]
MKFFEYFNKNMNRFMLGDHELVVKEVDEDFVLCESPSSEEIFIIPLSSIKHIVIGRSISVELIS